VERQEEQDLAAFQAFEDRNGFTGLDAAQCLGLPTEQYSDIELDITVSDNTIIRASFSPLVSPQ
jgi:hypothetical protein